MTEWLQLPDEIGPNRRALTEFVTPDFGHLYVPGRLLCKEKTPYQEIEIIETETFGRAMFLDGKIQVSDLDEDRYHQYLVQGPILAHPRARSIYIIGGGDGGGVEEAAKHTTIERIVMAELDQVVIERAKTFLPHISKGAFSDPRLELRCVDALEDLSKSRDRYDVIIVDLTEPHGPSKMLYTHQFYALLAERLTPGGRVGLHTDNYWLFPESYGTIYNTLASVFGTNLVTAHLGMPCFGMDWSFRIVSPGVIDLELLESNFKAARDTGMALDAFDPSSYRVKPTRQENDVIRRYARVSTNQKPFDKFEVAPAYITGKPV